MKRLSILMAATAAAAMLAVPAVPAAPPTSWDGLVQVKSKRLDLVYLQPGADLRGYTKVLIEPTEIAFAKNWQRDYNSGSRMLAMRVSDSDMHKAIALGVKASHDIFTEAWTKGGFAIATEPGPDVLRVRTGIVNIRISAPERPSAGRVTTFSREAGSATLFVEARDSLTNALIGRGVDQALAGDNMTAWRNASSNRADFRQMVENWATISVHGVTELKSHPVIAP